MRKYIHIHNLTDKGCDLEFGRVAIDVDTGEACYFSHFDDKGIFDPENIYPFNPENIDGDLAWHMERSGYPTEKISDELHPELIDFIEKAIVMHREYNEKNGYRTDLLDFNQKNLRVWHVPSYTIFGKEESAFFFPFENRINLYCDRYEYEVASKREKNEEKSNVIHEIGHMKVSTFKLDGNTFTIRTGFAPSIAILDPVTLKNGDIFYEVKESPDQNANLEMKALEEIINDTDCSKVDKTFMRTYPNIGDSLNNLCDKMLPKLREEDDAFLAYCDYLKGIAKSADLVDEINGLIMDALYGTNRRKHEMKALKLIKQCEENKRNNSLK